MDPIAGPMRLAVEAKATAGVTVDHLRGLRDLHEDHPRARRIVVCLESRRRATEHGIEILPVSVFVKELEALISA